MCRRWHISCGSQSHDPLSLTCRLKQWRSFLVHLKMSFGLANRKVLNRYLAKPVVIDLKDVFFERHARSYTLFYVLITIPGCASNNYLLLYLMLFEQSTPLVLSEEGSKRTSTTKHTLLSLHQCILWSSVVRDPCYVPGHEYWIWFCSLRLRDCSLEEIKRYKSRLVNFIIILIFMK